VRAKKALVTDAKMPNLKRRSGNETKQNSIKQIDQDRALIQKFLEKAS